MRKPSVKASVRARDGGCVDCGLTNDAHFAKHGKFPDVHRLKPGEPYSVDGCVTVCRPCHRLRHKALRTAGVVSVKGKWSELSVRLPDKRLAFALDQIAKAERRSRNTVMVMAIEAALASEGLWPPQG